MYPGVGGARIGRTACLRIFLRQELFRMGILYFDEQHDDSHAKENAVSCNVPLKLEVPTFITRPSRRSRRRRSTWRSLPLCGSFSDLTDDPDIARLIFPIPPPTTTIQHRDPIPSISASIVDIDVPLSLPTQTTASSSSHHLNRSKLLLHNIQTFVPPSEDWTFIDEIHPHTPHGCTPSSEPETWILCDDS
jgi:hypothetical protein